MKSSAPILRPNSSSISSSLEVRKITGKSVFWRRRRSSSMPSMRGILMSRMAISAGCSLQAVERRGAVGIGLHRDSPRPPASCATEVRMLRSSSTSAIVGIVHIAFVGALEKVRRDGTRTNCGNGVVTAGLSIELATQSGALRTGLF